MPLPLKPFPTSNLCTRRIKSSKRHRLVDAGGGESGHEAVTDSGAKRPLGFPWLSGEIPGNLTVRSS